VSTLKKVPVNSLLQINKRDLIVLKKRKKKSFSEIDCIASKIDTAKNGNLSIFSTGGENTHIPPSLSWSTRENFLE
jgi:hypothetical protein